MSKHKLRQDKTCLNCGAFVDNKYCPKCGQENKESRESFLHLMFEFMSDLVHFDSSFWKTTRSLLLSPAKLSQQYMLGKRQSYVNPVKLYIFISFLAFLLPAILPYPHPSKEHVSFKNSNDKLPVIIEIDTLHLSRSEEGHLEKVGNMNLNLSTQKNEKEDMQSQPDHQDKTVKGVDDESRAKKNIDKFTDVLAKSFYKLDSIDVGTYGKIASSLHLESVHNTKEPHEQLSFTDYMKYKIIFNIKENSQDRHKQEKMKDFVVHSLPKILFVYMPIFAFWMSIFNLNRKKYYFDSGIFTLHFFSFLLLLITLFIIVSCIFEWLNFSDLIYGFMMLAMIIYMLLYFFKANRIFYEEKRWIANLKSILLIAINIVIILLIFISIVVLAIGRSYS